MNSYRPHFIFFLASISTLFCPLKLVFAEEAESPALSDRIKAGLNPIVEFLDIELPETLEKRNVRLSIRPKIRDFIDLDHIRIPLQLRYGINDHTEAEIVTHLYSDNWFSSDYGGYGIASVGSGIKYKWTQWLTSYVQTATGSRVDIAVNDPPEELHDGYSRWQNYITFSRPINDTKDRFVFLNLTHEAVFYQTNKEHPYDTFSNNNAIINTGIYQKYSRGQYGLRLLYRFKLNCNKDDQIILTPFIEYQIPARYTHWIPGEWHLEIFYDLERVFAYRDEDGNYLQPDESRQHQRHYDLGIRVRWKFNIRKWVQKSH